MNRLIKRTIKGAIAAACTGGVIAAADDYKSNKDRIHTGKDLYRDSIKRGLDFTVGATALIMLLPVYSVLYVLVKTKLGSPVLFVQERPGKNDKIFKLYKFRSMTDGKDEKGNLLPDEERMTPFGEKLRATSLDELPEIINIVKGDMSIIGPRPLLVRYLDRYNDFQRRRNEVRPGLSGLAQISGRNSLSWEERFRLDVEYVDNISPMLDFKILLKTVLAVVKKEGISSDTSVTMEEFMGNMEKTE